MYFQIFLKLPTYLTHTSVPEPYARSAPTYRSLLGEAAWMRIDPAIRARFGDMPGERAFYGMMTTVRLSLAGRGLALLSRLFGKSLCPKTGRHIVTKIDIEGEASHAAGTWNRSYLLPRGRRFTVTSVKRFDPELGLLECLGRGFVMRLELKAERDALHFISSGYEWQCGPLRLALPHLLSPGQTHVVHRELGGGRFRFTLAINHPWLGELVFQQGDFFERENVSWKP
jgi:hypothetical protein